MQLSAYLAVDAAVAHLQAQEMTSPGVSAAHKFDHTPEIPLARAFQKMHCLKEGHDRVMIHRQLTSSYLVEVYKKAPLPTSEEPNFLVLSFSSLITSFTATQDQYGHVNPNIQYGHVISDRRREHDRCAIR